jgi:chaperone required for assembly of F1-ATPase
MKRFYREATCGETAGGWQVLLDGRGVKTVGGLPQLVPTQALAKALVAEWAEQGEQIDSKSLVLRDMADYALDVVAPDPAATIAALLPYGETDTLCYRAEPEEPLHARQVEVWEPLLRAAEARWDVHFERVSGVLHRPQPAPTLARMHAALAALDPFALAALRNTASLAASLVIGLAALEPDADIAALWNAAELEEHWQAGLWGEDAEAAHRRERRLDAFTAASRFAALARAG